MFRWSKSGLSRVLCASIIALFCLPSFAYAVDYTISGTYADLQSAIYSAAADGANSSITITEAGMYNCPFVAPYTASERSYELTLPPKG